MLEGSEKTPTNYVKDSSLCPRTKEETTGKYKRGSTTLETEDLEIWKGTSI